MSTTRERLEAITRVAAETGRSRAQVLRVLAPTYRPEEVIQLHAALARTPEPPTAAEVAAVASAQTAAAKAAAERRTAADGAALSAWRDYSALRRTNPVQAAALMNRDAFEINRGRQLAATQTEPPEPPKDAA